MAEIKYEVVERIAVLSQRPRGWERQLNLISWNDGEPKYDIRDWCLHRRAVHAQPERLPRPARHLFYRGRE